MITNHIMNKIVLLKCINHSKPTFQFNGHLLKIRLNWGQSWQPHMTYPLTTYYDPTKNILQPTPIHIPFFINI